MHLVSVADLNAQEIRELLRRSRELDQRSDSPRGGTIALLFLTSSLRTFVGFHAAGLRLGLHVVDINERRSGALMSAPESVTDTLRTVSGMVDAVVMRSDIAVADLDLARTCPVAFVNAGDTTSHPTQALIDMRAVEDEAGPVSEQVVAISGDLNSRAARSFIDILGTFPPRKLVVMAAPGRRERMARLSQALAAVTEERDPADIDDVDVLYLPGLPERSTSGDLDEAERSRFAFTAARAEHMKPSAVVLSPMPVIDEVADDCRDDPRVRLFGPSDRSVSVRAAVLEWVLDR